MIKQYMTTAAILAAGTMLAGAAVDGWTDATYTLVGNNNDNGISEGGNGLTNGRGAFETITVGEESLSTPLSAAAYSWKISFDVSSTDTNSAVKMVYSSMGGGSGNGVALAVSYDGSEYTYQLRTGSNIMVGSKPVLTADSGVDSITTSSTNVTLTWDTNADTFSLGVGDDVLVYSSGLTDDWFTLDTYTRTEIENGGGNDKNGSVFWTNSGVNSVSNITLSVAAAIPEPSAFGLLAGLGALALVASRRRCK